MYHAEGGGGRGECTDRGGRGRKTSSSTCIRVGRCSSILIFDCRRLLTLILRSRGAPCLEAFPVTYFAVLSTALRRLNYLSVVGQMA